MNDTSAKIVQDHPIATTDIELGKRQLDKFGYTVHESLISADEVARTRSRLEEQAALELEQGVASFRMANEITLGDRELGRPAHGALPAWQAILALPNKGREFIDLAMNPVVAEYGRHILGGVPFFMAQSTGLVVRRGSGGQVLHSDQQPIPFATPSPVYFHAMVALSDFEVGMGVTEMVPGSHHWPSPRIGRNPQTGKAESLESFTSEPMVCKAGSAVIFESRTWHFQGRSSSDKTRLSILNGYCMHFMRPQDDYVASLHDDVYDNLSEAEKRMLGFEVVAEYTGRVFPRSETDSRGSVNARYPYIPELRSGVDRRAIRFEDMHSDES
ncbi:phytanoyl-CoA dioxygenase family protein [Rhodococcus jostii]|uniref:Phytanoyl-CoA dioxygenase family protein n=1 Tax=Rhodococcus jostii TaxID=132919 RepID=A0ABU4CHZ7_RHOJO|nr:phytanoyl-CoA dioxygenase family protein [Rhodococcus jostii]MDV6283179.1 phytanoyl-CoA dioxygenase family protein [Rhodococcus jostii]